ncbi:MAG: discoidin domain-containing protein [Chloroflexi bacterium]|nr:discoidin domain-containing protein [Chloroflexota bacterium]
MPASNQEWSVEFLSHDTPVSVVIGQTLTVNLRVRNTGARAWQQSGRNAVHVGFKWFDEMDRQIEVHDRRTALPADLAPQHSLALGALLATPKMPGKYKLAWDLIAEASTEFDAPLIVPVAVTAAPCDVTGWRAESNLNPAHVAHALDGEMFTTWDSGAPQAPGQWFRVNLGMPRVVDGVQFLSPGKGFPCGYVLNASPDGRAWNSLARVARDNAHDVVAVFAPQRIQYLQIDLLANAEASWQISDVLIHSATMWTASASHNFAAAACAIDNRDDSLWTSDAPQSPAMWFQIDLGRIETVSGIALASPAAHLPAGYRITTWNASASRWQIAYEKSRNDAPVNVSFGATPTQFVNIQLLAASDRPWSIRRVDIEREMESWLDPAAAR